MGRMGQSGGPKTADTLSNIQILKRVLEIPGAKSILNGLSSYCEKDGQSRLLVALDLYFGAKHDACLRCKMAEKSVAAFVRLGSGAFGVSKDEMRKHFQDPYWRRGLASVIKGLGVFGLSKPFVPGAPIQVVWNITSRCNLNCRHCYASANSVPLDEMGTADAKMCIDKLARWGVACIAFSGGEPLMRHDILELASYSSSRGIYSAVATNGVLLSKEKCRELKEAAVGYLQISLDGASPETHDAFRGVSGMFDRTITGIKNAVSEGFFVNIATTVTQYNIAEIPKVIDLCEALGVQWSMLYNFIPTGRGMSIETMDLTPEQREAVLKLIWSKMKSSKVNILSTAPQFARVALQADGPRCNVIPTHFANSELGGQLQSLSDFIGGCGAGRFYMAMAGNGDIIPCVFLPYVVGNVFRDDLDVLWKRSSTFLQLRNREQLKEHCGSCEFKYVCGGCRARAYSYFNDYTQPDPGCMLNIKAYERILPNNSNNKNSCKEAIPSG